LFLLGAAPAAHADVDYQLRVSDAAQHLAEVRATLPAVAGNTLDVQMPNWRTGRYQIVNSANGVASSRRSTPRAKRSPSARPTREPGKWPHALATPSPS
ncbi:hypothetical protein D0817_25910, partial [Flavobacterium cupreum]